MHYDILCIRNKTCRKVWTMVATKKLYELSLFINTKRNVHFSKFPQPSFMEIILINLEFKGGVMSHFWTNNHEVVRIVSIKDQIRMITTNHVRRSKESKKTRVNELREEETT